MSYMFVRGYITYYKAIGTFYLACWVPPWYSEHGRLWVT
jgi:hypothetical protein